MQTSFSGSLLTALVFAAHLLLACDGCRSPAPTDSIIDDPQLGEPLRFCRLFDGRAISGSTGEGPINAVATSNGVSLLYRGDHGAVESLYHASLGFDLTPLAPPEALESTTSGPLVPEALATDRTAVAAVGRQEGARRAYLFSKLGDEPFDVVDTPHLAALDRRVAVRLIEPRAGGGIQVITHLSGSREIGVGRLAGGILVTRELEVPQLLVAPEAVSAPGGALAIFTAELFSVGRRIVSIREVDPDATPSRNTAIAELAEGERVEQLGVAVFNEHYRAAWLLRGADGTTIERAEVDEEALNSARLEPIVPAVDGAEITAFAFVARERWTTIVWEEQDGDRTTIWLSAEQPDGAEIGQAIVAERDGSAFDGLTLVSVGDRDLLLFRETKVGESSGEVAHGYLDCDFP